MDNNNVSENTPKISNTLTRRSLFAAAAMGAGGLYAGRQIFAEQPHEIIRSILTAKLKPAYIPEKTYQDFLKVYLETEHYTGMFKAYRLFSSIAWLYPTGAIHRIPQFKAKIELMEELVVTHFTLSTNFFLDPLVMKGENPVTFISYWRQRACNNPFARFERA